MELAEALTSYRGHTLAEMLGIFRKTGSIGTEGKRSLELDIVKVEMNLPEGFFQKALDLIDATV